MKYGRLTLVKFVPGSRAKCSWLCDCGKIKEIRIDAVKSGRTKSCGCLQPEIARDTIIASLTKHGFAKKGTIQHALYDLWHNIISRSFDPKNKRYKDYGGRGIIVCDEWKTSPGNFINWSLNNGYQKGLQIDRINNNSDRVD